MAIARTAAALVAAALALALEAGPLMTQVAAAHGNDPDWAAMKEIARLQAHAREGGGNLLSETVALRALEPAFKQRSPGAAAALALELLRLEAELGNYAAAHRYADLAYGSEGVVAADARKADDLLDLQQVDALAYIVGAADRERVIMINEAHHVPQHRAFSLALLYALRAKGFRYFAAETLAEADADLNRRGYPIESSGGYSSEPVYGDLVRTALSLGYRVVAYEAAGADDRERGQAQNLVRRTVGMDPSAKVFVHAGYAHIAKAGTVAGKATMVRQFTELTGITPFTVDQTVMTEHSKPDYEDFRYRALAAKGLQRPCILLQPGGAAWTSRPGQYDATVFHPRSRYEHGRPTWLLLNGLRHVYALPADICKDLPDCMVRARFSREASDSVPIDQVEIAGHASPLALLLPSGSFVIESESPAGTMVARIAVDIPSP